MKGRTIPLFGATPLAASRLESSFLLSPFGLDRLHILRIAISPTKIQVHLGNLSANRIEIDIFFIFFPLLISYLNCSHQKKRVIEGMDLSSIVALLILVPLLILPAQPPFLLLLPQTILLVVSQELE